MTDERKPDVVLSNGREITFDFSKVTYGEVHGVFDPKDEKIRTDETIGKSAGMSIDEIYALTGADYKRLAKGFVNRWINWKDDPND